LTKQSAFYKMNEYHNLLKNMNFGFSNRRALLILAVVLIVLVVGGAVSSKWQASIFKSLNKDVMEATVAPESFYFEDSQNQLQQSFSQIGELGQDEISPAEPVQESETAPSKSEIPLTMEEIQDRVDDIAEQIDIITEEVKKLALSNVDEPDPDNQEDADQDSDDSDNQQVLANLVSSGGGASPAVYPKILFTEVKIAEKTGDKNIFIELYNPNSFDVDLTNWYIFRNDNSFIAKSSFNGKEISSYSYFLVARRSSIWENQADIVFDDSKTLNDDDKITLKNPSGEIVDEVFWTQVRSGFSFGRKWITASQTYQDTDNNSADFEVQTPTPKAQNSQAPAPNPFPDVNNDSKVNVLDLILIRNRLGSNELLYDVNNDGVVDIKDLEYVRNILNKPPEDPAPQNQESVAQDPVLEPLETENGNESESESELEQSEPLIELEADIAAEPAPSSAQNDAVVPESLPADLPVQQNDSPAQQP